MYVIISCWFEQLQYTHCHDCLVFGPSVPPTIQPGPRVMKVQLGYPVELPCIVRGVPEPSLTWAKDGVSYPVSPDGSLAFGTVGLDDEGTYTCTATNTAGKDEARVQLLVQGWFHPKLIVYFWCFISIKCLKYLLCFFVFLKILEILTGVCVCLLIMVCLF